MNSFVLLLVACTVVMAVALPSIAIPQMDPEKLLATLFKLLKINDVDPQKCASDLDATQINFKDFSQEMSSKNYSMAVHSLSDGISSLSSSVADCGLVEITSKLDSLALSIKFAKINTSGLDNVVQIIVGASDLWIDFTKLETAIESGDGENIANALVTIMKEYSQITGGCKPDQKGCNFIDGLVQIIKQVSQDITPCEEALSGIVTQMETAVTAWDAKDYQSAVTTMATALDAAAVALQNEACGLKKIGDLIGKLSPKLASAIVKVEDGKAVQIIVGAADVYDNIFRALQALKQQDYKTFGQAIGNLLRELRASGCSTKACIVLEGLMASVEAEAEDFDACMTTADQSWDALSSGVNMIVNKNPVDGLKLVGQGLVELAQSVSACNIPQIAQIAEDMFTKLGDSTIATDIGAVVSVLVEGSDITLNINSAVKDFNGKNWAAFGSDLGSLAQLLTDSKCHSVTCQIIEGFLAKAGIAFEELETCESELSSTVDIFTQAAQQWEANDYDTSIHLFANGLSSISKVTKDCGLSNDLSYIEQEAHVLGFGNVTSKINADMAILVHGFDFFADFKKAVEEMKAHDFRSAGETMQTVMDTLYQWSGKHVCTGDHCYIVVGILQFMGDIQGSLQECESDFKSAFNDFHLAASNFSDSHENRFFHWNHDKTAIKMGLHSLGDGMHLVSKGVSDCHIQEFADLLEALAVKLGVAPEISWIEELLHILINGVNIEDEIGTALDDWADNNWPGFGYNLAKLIKTLLKM